MNALTKLGIGIIVLLSSALAAGYGAYRSAMRKADEAYADLVDRATPPTSRFNQTMVADLPEVAQRYFRHAVAPGTPLYSAAKIEMQGTFLLGDRRKNRSYCMYARQALRPPTEFVWSPRLRSGVMTISGSDAMVRGEAWTRFWLWGFMPVAHAGSSPDMFRSAQFRGAVESALWMPTSMLPANGAKWEQVGPNQARVMLTAINPTVVLDITLDAQGAVRAVVGQRWSNANLEQQFRLQPFGGTMSADRTFQGLTIPTVVSVGNHYGTEDYLPFFQARITNAKFF